MSFTKDVVFFISVFVFVFLFTLLFTLSGCWSRHDFNKISPDTKLISKPSGKLSDQTLRHWFSLDNMTVIEHENTLIDGLIKNNIPYTDVYRLVGEMQIIFPPKSGNVDIISNYELVLLADPAEKEIYITDQHLPNNWPLQ